MASTSLSASLLHVHLCLTSKVKLIGWLLAAGLVVVLAILALPEAHTAPSSVPMPVIAPAPIVTVDLPDEVMIGEDFTFEVKFDNGPGADVGYGPYIELYLPAWDPDGNTGGIKCDGIRFQTTVTPVAIFTSPSTVPLVPVYHSSVSSSSANQDCPDSTNSYTLPFAGMTYDPNVPSGVFELVVLELPFGSFDATQREVTVRVTAHLSDYADQGTPLTIYARGGFKFGKDPLNHPSDPLIESSPLASDQTTPIVLKISKAYMGPEGETASGPNYPRTYNIAADIANLQEIKDLVITDNLPSNLQFIGNTLVTVQGGGANVVTACAPSPGPLDVVVSLPTAGQPGGVLSVKLCSPVTGSVTQTDVAISFNFFIPELDAAGNLILQKDCSNAPVAVENDISATGNWDPKDPRDAAANATIPVNTDLHKVDNIFQAKCLAIQKSKVTVV